MSVPSLQIKYALPKSDMDDKVAHLKKELREGVGFIVSLLSTLPAGYAGAKRSFQTRTTLLHLVL